MERAEVRAPAAQLARAVGVGEDRLLRCCDGALGVLGRGDGESCLSSGVCRVHVCVAVFG